ncbi:MAG: TlpA family protein disulfide reductase [Solirubrobacteraceae bacterium]
MVAIVSVETVLLVLLVVLVIALLRSHAEILRRLGPEGAAPPLLPDPPVRARRETAAPEIAGMTPTGDAIKLSLSGAPTLLAFLSSGCTSCAPFWETLGERPLHDGLQPMIVTRGPDREQRAKLRALAPAAVAVVMSSQAWEEYAVPGSPYFVMVEGGEIRGEGVATTWDALTSLLADAVEEQRGIDERLARAGIGPDHPSLYSELSAAPDGGVSRGVRV